MRLKTLFLLPLFLLITACGGGADRPGSGEGDEGDPVQGGTAIVSMPSDHDALNQFVSTSFETNEVLRWMLFTPLVRLNREMEYEPYLAQDFELSDDGLSLAFTLRDGVRWHDDEPLTADDIVWSVNMYMDPELAYANLQYFSFVDRVEKIDENHIVFHFNAVHSEPLADFLDWQPMPRHLLEGIPAAEMKSAPFNRNPVGNGPFRFVSWNANQQVVFEANEDFFLGRPNLDRVVYRIIPEQTTQVTEVLTGQIDLVRGIPPSEAATIENSDQARLVSYSGRSYEYVAWNIRNPLFEDVRVRRAMTMGIDRQQIVDALLFGYGEIASSDIMPFQWQYAGLDPLPHDIEQAKALLAEAGWRDTDGDGVVDKDGRPFRFVLETNAGNDLRQDITVIIQNNLAQIGIDAQPRQAEFNNLIDRLQNKDFVAAVMGWNVDFKFDPTETMSCSGGVYNFPSYCNAEADSLMTQALVTVDHEEAQPLWTRYQEIIQRDQPYTFLYYLNERIAVSNRLRGYAGDARGYMASVADWWIPENLQ